MELIMGTLSPGTCDQFAPALTLRYSPPAEGATYTVEEPFGSSAKALIGEFGRPGPRAVQWFPPSSLRYKPVLE